MVTSSSTDCHSQALEFGGLKAALELDTSQASRQAKQATGIIPTEMATMAEKRIGVLVLCTGNSCRSQMFEAYLKRYGGDKFDVVSAGTEPADRIHPLTRVVLNEDGIDTAGMVPKDYRSFLGRIAVYYLFIVCNGAAKSCPSVWPGVMERIIWPFDDPAAFEGPKEEKLDRFRLVRDQIKDRVESWVAHPR